MTDLVAEFSSVEYLTDTKLSRFTWIPDCVQVGAPDYYPKALDECQRFIFMA